MICDLPKEVIEAVLNESNPSLNQESSLNLIKSDCSAKVVGKDNEEMESEELSEQHRREKGDEEKKGIEDGSKEQQEEKKVGKSSFERVLSHLFLVS